MVGNEKKISNHLLGINICIYYSTWYVANHRIRWWSTPTFSSPHTKSHVSLIIKQQAYRPLKLSALKYFLRGPSIQKNFFFKCKIEHGREEYFFLHSFYWFPPNTYKFFEQVWLQHIPLENWGPRLGFSFCFLCVCIFSKAKKHPTIGPTLHFEWSWHFLEWGCCCLFRMFSLKRDVTDDISPLPYDLGMFHATLSCIWLISPPIICTHYQHLAWHYRSHYGRCALCHYTLSSIILICLAPCKVLTMKLLRNELDCHVTMCARHEQTKLISGTRS